ncbi:MAG TPA: hypothetical protein DEP43_02410 [Ruminococcaceae bacterium]|nr:hypothetical protein [Oscillospiraceae bacterium]HCB64807.1 hypothetical protein [Oscillospiraceae bacterium]
MQYFSQKSLAIFFARINKKAAEILLLVVREPFIPVAFERAPAKPPAAGVLRGRPFFAFVLFS